MRDSVSIGAKHPAAMIFDCALVIRCGTVTVQEVKKISLGNLKTLFFCVFADRHLTFQGRVCVSRFPIWGFNEDE